MGGGGGAGRGPGGGAGQKRLDLAWLRLLAPPGESGWSDAASLPARQHEGMHGAAGQGEGGKRQQTRQEGVQVQALGTPDRRACRCRH